MLAPSAVKQFYDRFGDRQNRQGFYEDRALADLVAHADLAGARTVTEFGCGTGRLAASLLSRFPNVAYVGFDISTTMLGLARKALSPFGARAVVAQLAAGTVRLPVAERSSDVLLSSYVLDLLSAADITAFVQEAQRVLAPGGRLCLVGLTSETTGLPRLVARLWSAVHRLRPQLVGGCRPIRLREYLDPATWKLLHHRTVAPWAIPSEVVVAQARETR